MKAIFNYFKDNVTHSQYIYYTKLYYTAYYVNSVCYFNIKYIIIS